MMNLIEWDQTIGSIIQISLLLIFLAALLWKHKQLGRGFICFIAGNILITTTNIVIFIIHQTGIVFHTKALYSICVNFGSFLILFIYFHKVLRQYWSKVINVISMVCLVIGYSLFVYFETDFFNRLPVGFFLFEVVLLMTNIFLVLRETFNSDKILYIRTYYPFWACIGLMAIYLGITPLMVIGDSSTRIINVNIFFLLLFIVNMLGYAILLIGIFYAEGKNSQRRGSYRN